MTGAPFELWAYLSSTPLLWLTVTIVVYICADGISKVSGRMALLHPLILSVTTLALILIGTGTTYKAYLDGAQFVHFLLGPATVALGIPLYENRHIVRRALLPSLCALVAGSLTATVSALAIAKALGAPQDVLISLAPKTVTSPVAIGVSQTLGGDPSLTAAIVVATGTFGILFIAPLMSLLRIRDRRARGIAAGIACHGIGTAYSFQENPVTGSFASVGMGLCCLITTAVIPLILKWMGIL